MSVASLIAHVLLLRKGKVLGAIYDPTDVICSNLKLVVSALGMPPPAGIPSFPKSIGLIPINRTL